MAKASNKQASAPQEPTTAPEPQTVPSPPTPEVPDVPTETPESDSQPADEGSAGVQNTTNGPVPVAVPPAEPEQDTEDPEVPAVGGFTDTTAGNTPQGPIDSSEMKIPQATEQSKETKLANAGVQDKAIPPIPGKLNPQKSLTELEDEIDSGQFTDIPSFVKKHWEAKDANVQIMAEVLRMEPREVYAILKEDLGVSFPQGV